MPWKGFKFQSCNHQHCSKPAGICFGSVKIGRLTNKLKLAYYFNFVVTLCSLDICYQMCNYLFYLFCLHIDLHRYDLSGKCYLCECDSPTVNCATTGSLRRKVCKSTHAWMGCTGAQAVVGKKGNFAGSCSGLVGAERSCQFGLVIPQKKIGRVGIPTSKFH